MRITASNTSSLADDQAFARRLHDGNRNFLEMVDFEDALDLGEQAVQKPEVAAGDADHGSDGFGAKAGFGKSDPVRSPARFQQIVHIGGRENTELMHETDAGVELRVSCEPLFYARHADQNQAYAAHVEAVSNLLEAVHAQPVGLVDQNECCWVGDGALPLVIKSQSIQKRRAGTQRILPLRRRPVEVSCSRGIILCSQRVKHFPGLFANRSFGDYFKPFAGSANAACNA